MIKRLQEYFAFTKNEQKVFLFLATVFLLGVAIKIYKTYVIQPSIQQFDYSQQDSIFKERSQLLLGDSLAVNGSGERIIVNINTANKNELMTLPGIGEATAERIILHREEIGSFTSIRDLKKVKGIGEKKFDKLKTYIEVK
jgi:comEA protein